MISPLPGLVERITGRRVLVVGDVILDEYLDGDAARISPEAPVPVLRFAGQQAVLGGAANTAANVSSLGGRATLVGLVGDDAAGAAVRRLCTDAGIQLEALSDGRETTRKVRVVSRQQQLLRIDYETTADVDAPCRARLMRALAPHVASADIVVVSDYAKGLLSSELLEDVRTAAAAAGHAVVVDPRPRHASFYTGCDYLTPNWKEALALIGEGDADPTPDAVRQVGGRVRDRFLAGVLLTLGARGMVFFAKDGSAPIEAAAEAREVFDVSGAGDTVVAAFALALAGGAAPADAVWLANRAAAVVVGKRGTATVTADELARDALLQ
jgi:D-beta-D-heptose 7-phosphate kinase/D-beta-D-heptose 1-phosphate adenosyltransferase